MCVLIIIINGGNFAVSFEGGYKMDEINVFEFMTMPMIGFGISIWFNKPLIIYIEIPFLQISIFCKKTKDNKWF